MNWSREILIVLTLVVIGGVLAWGYAFFVAPQSVESVTADWTLSCHADAESISFSYWDEEGSQIPSVCAKCHSLEGYLDFLGVDGSTEREVDESVRGGTILTCRTCHNELAHEMTEVEFPSGAVVGESTQAANCMQCHQGRRATEDVRSAIGGRSPDGVSEQLGFINVHYAIGAATLWGGEVRAGYQYEGESYAGRYEHVEDYDTCIECHNPHSTFRNPDTCSPCHLNVVDISDLREIRATEVDYDGDGNVEEPIRQEVASFRDALYAAIQDYAAEVIGEPIVYDRETHPYFFEDPGNGDLASGDAYDSWTPRLVRAAYNYHYVHADPGAYVHNARYVLQLLYDSTEDLGQAVPVDIEGFVRP